MTELRVVLRKGSAPAWGLLAFGLAGAAVFAARPTSTLGEAAFALVSTVAVVAGNAAVWRRRGSLPELRLLLGGAAIWLLAQWVWWILDLAGTRLGFPSVADAIYVSGSVPILIGIVVAWRRQLTSVTGGLLYGGALASAGGLLLWQLVLDAPGGTNAPLPTAVAAVGYPMLDAFLLIGLGQLLLSPALRRVPAAQALTAGMLFYLLSDVSYTYKALRGPVEPAWQDVGWVLLFGLWGFAALHPSSSLLGGRRAQHPPTTIGRVVVLALAVLLAPVTVVVATHRHTFDPDVYASAMSLILVLVFARMGVLLSQFRRAQADADEGHEFYRALVDNSTDLVMLMGMNGALLFASPSFEEILGYAPADVVGTNMLDYTDPEDLPLAHETLAATVGGAEPPPFAIRARDRRGDVVWLEVTATLVSTRNGPAILSQARDVTKRKAAEESLAETSGKLEALIAASPAAIVALDGEGRVTLWSPGAERLFGWTAEEVLGKPTPLRSARELAEDFLAPSVEGGLALEEGMRPRKDGTLVDVLRSMAPLVGEDGSTIGLFGVFLDISERRQLEVRLRQAQRLEAVGQLAGGVAHDFNNLLLVIRGYAQVALAQVDGDAELGQSIEEIVRAGERATELTRQLLAFSRRQTLQPETFDLNVAVFEATGLLSRLLGEQIRVVTSLASRSCGVLADPGQLEQVLMNLAVNARDAMPGGGTLTIRTERVEVGREEAEQLEVEPGPYSVLEVVDTGAGMDAETAAHAFEPFFTTKPVGAGTGLGLATVYGIVRQSGGAVTLDTEPGRGTNVRILLPEHPLAATIEHTVAPAAPRGSERILLVEDEAPVRRLTAQLLEAQGYDVVDAADPYDAIELASSTPIDLLATDVVMPGMDGGELAARLRAERPTLPVLFISGYAPDAVLGSVQPETRTSFLGKPFSAADLAQAVRATLDDGR